MRLLADALSHDPDPRVRAEAANQLGYADSIGAVRALLRALKDSDPTVVAAAVESLGFTADDSVIPDLEPLLQHPDAQVREQAKRVIEFLR